MFPRPRRGASPSRRRRSLRLRPLVQDAVLESRQLLTATIIDNSAAAPAFTKVGGWIPFTAGYLNNELLASASSSGSAVSTWTFAGTTAGRYRVAATWAPRQSPATNANFQIFQGTTLIQSAPTDESQAPNDLTDENNVNWEYLGPAIDYAGGDLVVKLNNNANGFVIADAIRLERLDQPKLDVFQGAAPFAKGSTYNFGDTLVGSPLSATFTVSNSGFSNLVLNAPITVPAGFSVTSSFGTTVLAPNQSTNFTIQYNASAEGTSSGVVSFGSNDPLANPFTFNVTGSAAGVVQGPRVTFKNGGVTVANGGSVSFGLAAPGSVSKRTFTVLNSGTDPLVLDEPIVTPGTNFGLTSGLTATTLAPGDSATFVVSMGTAQTGFYTGSVSFTSNDPNQSPFKVNLTGSVGVSLSPRILLFDGSNPLESGSGQVEFAPTTPGSPSFKIITVANAGAGQLDLVGQPLVPAGYSVVQNYAASSLLPGETTVFVVALDGSPPPGIYSGPVSVFSNDPDTSPFIFNVTGVVAAREGPVLQVYDGNSLLANGSGVNLGSTQVGNPLSKTFKVTNLGTEPLDLAPTIAVSPGFSLVSGFGNTTLAPGQSTTFTVQFNATTEGSFSGSTTFLSTDAESSPFTINLQAAATSVKLPDAEISSGGSVIADNTGSSAFGSTSVGNPILRVFTIKNTGSASLAVFRPTLPAGFSIVGSFSSQVVAPGASVNITIQLNATAAGFYSGPIKFLTNVPSKNPYDFTISGNVTAGLSLRTSGSSPAPTLIDPTLADAALATLATPKKKTAT